VKIGRLRSFSRTLAIAALGIMAHTSVDAQELKLQPTPFTAWIDFDALAKPGAPRPSFPIWLESVEIVQPEPDSSSSGSTMRIRLRRFPGLSDEMLLRVFFDDLPAHGPTVSAWTELGSNVFAPRTLGSGVDLPSSETVVIRTAEAAYIEIHASGTIPIVHAALLTSLRKAETRQGLDFSAAPAFLDPFEARQSEPAGKDTYLFGRVKAPLEPKPLRLSSKDGLSGVFGFELETQPLVAIFSFEILNTDVTHPPEVEVNGTAVGSATLILPDLADPAFRGAIRPGSADAEFRYTGWIPCQKIIPGSALRAGENSLTLHSGDLAGSVAVRRFEVQLKYPSEVQPNP
jgi:hypothetical protein